MSADIVQAQYEQLEQIAARFANAAETQQALLQRVNQRVDVLRQGGWQGKGVAAFLREMDGEVGPAGLRLVDGLRAAGDRTSQIRSSMMLAEHSAALLFQSGGSVSPEGSYSMANPDFDGVASVKDAQYTKIPGTPFVAGNGDSNSVSVNDVAQGQLGDCYFIASMAAVAQYHPDHIKNMIKDNGNGTYTVTLYERRSAWEFWKPEFNKVEVSVTAEFPSRQSSPVFAQPGDSSAKGQELWPMLLEKAYAQHKGGYDTIEGGWTHDALETITGKATESHKPSDLTIRDLASYVRDHRSVGVESLPDRKISIGGHDLFDLPDDVDNNPLYQSDRLVSNHSYYLTKVDEANGTVTVRNPWGWSHSEITMTLDEFKTAFQRVSVNQL